jgi:pimeloyl-ACP methyl ester carboxylesterase
MTPRRLLLRILFLVAVLALLVLGGYLAWFQSWRAGQMLDLAARSEVVKLPAGEMEFAVRGSGEPVLIFHSAPGGYDQALALGGFLEEEGFQIIAPSRPGYLRTPLSTGPAPENQAEAVAQLLDYLEIFQASVIGLGWGASAAIEFAKNFPDRASALVLVSAATSETPPAAGIPFPQALADQVGGDAASDWFLKNAARDPEKVLGTAFDLTSSGGPVERLAWIDSVLQEPSELERFQDLLSSLAPPSPRGIGMENDLAQPLASIRSLKTPALLVQGASDKVVPAGAGDRSRFAPAEILKMPGQGHLVLLGRGAAEASRRVVDFLRLHPSAGTPDDSTDGK